MFETVSVIVGLEIGTSKVCCVVSEILPDGSLNVIGVGQSKSSGVRKGEIVDPGPTERDLRHAIAEAEHMADVEIRSVYLGVTGGHIRGFNNRGVHPILSDDREIAAEDVQDVIKNAKAINLPMENTIVHTIRQHFLVDGQGGIQNPIGMLGAKVEVDVHVIHGQHNRLQNPIRTFKGLQLDVEAIAFNGLASAMAVLGNEHKELGALVIDIGAGTTDYVVYSNGIVKHSGVIGVGGDHVSNDLAVGLKVSMARAEKLKLEHGGALVQPEDRGRAIALKNELGLPDKNINIEHLRRIMSLRYQEIFELIEQDLDDAGLMDYLRAGVFICGGCARTPEIAELAENVFRLPIHIGRTNAISGLKNALEQPEFSTAIGLVKFGSLQQKQRTTRSSLSGGILQAVGSLFRRG